jgi:3D (Asp-Asp-Asp) domain-containing protein
VNPDGFPATLGRVRVHRFLALPLSLVFVGCAAAGEYEERSLSVTASAYNSVAAQTNRQPTRTAWGDELKPGVKAVAVSRDLIERGLTHGVVVTIEGLPGEYVVMDKMAARWQRKIDIYMGEDVEAARRWGVRQLTIHWRVEKD